MTCLRRLTHQVETDHSPQLSAGNRSVGPALLAPLVNFTISSHLSKRRARSCDAMHSCQRTRVHRRRSRPFFDRRTRKSGKHHQNSTCARRASSAICFVSIGHSPSGVQGKQSLARCHLPESILARAYRMMNSELANKIFTRQSIHLRSW